MKEKYIYYCVARPAGPFTVPKNGLVEVENFDTRQQFAFCKAWGKVTYNRPLTDAEIADFELHDNKPEKDDFLKFEVVDHLVFFTGTKEEREREERKENRNRLHLKSLYDCLLDGSIDYFYTIQEWSNGRKSVYVVHPSAKYEVPQLTCVTLDADNEFLYMTYDVKVVDFNKLMSELPVKDKVFYA